MQAKTALGAPRRAAFAATLTVTLLLSNEGGARAQSPTVPAPPASAPTAPANARVPLDANFSRLEMVTIGVATLAGIGMMTAGERLFGTPAPSLGPPAPGSFDRRWADRLHGDNGSSARFLGRFPDLAGLLVLPYLPALAYSIDFASILRTGAPLLSNDFNPDHRFFAYTEMLGWTMLVTGLTKVAVGRERPYVVLDHPELAGPARERNFSFFSSHSAVMFAAASFVALDLGRRLPDGPLAGWSPVGRWLVGRALPTVLAFGTASLVAVSRVIDQQHWPSDVLVGAAVGTGIAHLTYLAHFDEHGQPLRHRGPADGPPPPRLAPTPGGVALVGAF